VASSLNAFSAAIPVRCATRAWLSARAVAQEADGQGTPSYTAGAQARTFQPSGDPVRRFSWRSQIKELALVLAVAACVGMTGCDDPHAPPGPLEPLPGVGLLGGDGGSTDGAPEADGVPADMTADTPL
jgi:hypothetical protein